MFDKFDNELDDDFEREEREEETEYEGDEDDEELLENEETLEELDIDERGHVRPRHNRSDEDCSYEMYDDE